MRISILDDYFDTVRTLECFPKLTAIGSRSGPITFRTMEALADG